ncbi:hypothetical protein SprV_0200760600 [Sparganum proliferum]
MRTDIDQALITGVDGGGVGVSELCVVLMGMADATTAYVEVVLEEKEEVFPVCQVDLSTVVGDNAHSLPHGADARQRLERESASSEADLRSIYRTLLSHSPGSDGKTAPRRQGAGQSAVADKAKQSAHAWHTRPGLQYMYQACMRGSGGDWAHMRSYTKNEPLGLTLIHEKDPVTHRQTAFQTVVYAKQPSSDFTPLKVNCSHMT